MSGRHERGVMDGNSGARMNPAGARRAAMLAAALTLAGCVAPAGRVQDAAAMTPGPAEIPAEIPAASRPLAALIARAPGLSRFRALAAAGGLGGLLAGRGPATVLAPTDDAFERLPAGTVESLLLPGNRPSLLHLLRFWVVPGPPSVTDGGVARPPTLDGEALAVASEAGVTMLTDGGCRRGYVVRRTTASDGMLVETSGIIAPRSIEPGGGRMSDGASPP